MRFPVTVDGKETEIREFSDGDVIVAIEDRFYRIRQAPDDVYYYMLKVRGTQRSIRGTREKIREAVIRVHRVFKSYEDRVRRGKEEAQAQRDRNLNEIVESMQDAPVVAEQA